MALAVDVSTKELERVASLAYEGQVVSVILCLSEDESLTADSLVSDWENAELSGNGYARYTVTMGAGSYNPTSARYELPTFNAQFTATGNLVYNTIVVLVGTSSYPHSVLTENPNISLVAGQVQTYRISLSCDD